MEYKPKNRHVEERKALKILILGLECLVSTNLIK